VNIEKWVKGFARKYLVPQWGLDAGFAIQVARLFYWFWYYGLNPQITSGYRSAKKQADLRRRYEAGDPSVVYPPAAKSLHCTTGFLGGPGAKAVDISTNEPYTAAILARQLGLKPGYEYGDDVHFSV